MKDIIKFPARIPKSLYEKMEKRKKETMYSINLQIVDAIKNDKKINK